MKAIELYRATYLFPGKTKSVKLRFQKQAHTSLRDLVELAYQRGVRYLIVVDTACHHFGQRAYVGDALQEAQLLGGGGYLGDQRMY